MQRQNDGVLDSFPIWDDVRTFDGRPWRGIVDVVSGGFPCQDISLAGTGDGLDGERSGLWSEMRRIIGEVGPRFAFVENSPALIHRGLGTVLSDLAEMGFDARWGCFAAKRLGAPIERERIFIACANRLDGEKGLGHLAGWSKSVFGEEEEQRHVVWLQTKPDAAGMVDGVADYVGRVRAIGNGQVPVVVKSAWELLT